MKNRPLTLEHAFYALALVIGVGLRFLHLGALPLSDYEADWALQALNVARGLKLAISVNPGYIHLTAILFYILDATNFLARFLPALAGTALVLAPWMLRGCFGRVPALVLAFGLALDPGLAGLSRLAGGPMLAVASVVFAGLFWLDGRRAAAGLFAGLALLSGPSAWLGLLGLMLAWVVLNAFAARPSVPAEGDAAGELTVPGSEKVRPEGLRVALAWGLGTMLVVGSLLVLSPQGLPAIFVSFYEFLRGWWTLSGVPVWKPLLTLPAYEIVPLGFGIAGAVRGMLKKDADSLRLAVWALAALLLALIYPAKQTGDLLWALLPLWALATLEISHHFDFEGHNRWALAGVGTLVLVLLVFGWMQLAEISTMDLALDSTRLRFLLVPAVVLLVGLSVVLVGTGWSAAVARLGGVWGALTALTLFTVAMSTGATLLREPLTVELWQPEPRPSKLNIMASVVEEISTLNKVGETPLPLTLLNVDSPALRWLFRDWDVTEVTALSPDANPEMIITPITELSLTANYRGESMTLNEAPDWANATASDWLNWLVYRQMPLLKQDVILWVRSDLMLDSQGLP